MILKTINILIHKLFDKINSINGDRLPLGTPLVRSHESKGRYDLKVVKALLF